MSISLRQLSYFVALVDARHFGRAAACVNISQPALSMQIRELETTLGAPLVERGPREIRLTRAGRDLEPRARRILAEVRELEAAARRGLGGRVHLGIIPTVAPYLLARALPELRADPATRDLRLREAPTDVLLAALASGQLDAVVIATPAPDADHVVVDLFEDRFLLAGRADRIAALTAPETLRPRAIDPDQLLLLDEGHCLADQALEVCALDRGARRFDLGAASLTTLCGLVAQGLGLTFLPELAVATEAAANPGMSVIRFAAPEPARRIAIVCRAATDGSGWFDDLAAVLGRAGQAVTAATRV